jgi:hypothetical protein
MGTSSTVDRRNVSFLREHQAQRIEVDQLFAKARVGDPKREQAQALPTAA